MGIDLSIDDTPRYVLTGSVTDGFGETERFNEEVVDGWKVTSLFEDPPQRASIQLRTWSLEPPLPKSVADLRAHWAYSGFMRFRQRVAMTIGLDLRMMWGFQPSALEIGRIRGDERRAADMPGEMAWKAYEHAQIEWWEANARQWDTVDSPLVPFLHHSDCDGEMSAAECRACAPALAIALHELPSVDEWAVQSLGREVEWDPGRQEQFTDTDLEQGTVLVALMEACADYERELAFR